MKMDQEPLISTVRAQCSSICSDCDLYNDLQRTNMPNMLSLSFLEFMEMMTG